MNKGLFNQYTAHLRPGLIRYARTMNMENAEDLVQETYLKAYRSWEAFDGKSTSGWMKMILKNTFINQYRAQQRKPERLIAGVSDGPSDLAGKDYFGVKMKPAENPEDVVMNSSYSPELQAALKVLPENWIKVLVMHSEGFQYNEISETLGIPVGTVQSSLHRARNKMRASLAQNRA